MPETKIQFTLPAAVVGVLENLRLDGESLGLCAKRILISYTKMPDTKIPDTKIPDTKIPDTKIPDTKIPDTKILDTIASLTLKNQELEGRIEEMENIISEMRESSISFENIVTRTFDHIRQQIAKQTGEQPIESAIEQPIEQPIEQAESLKQHLEDLAKPIYYVCQLKRNNDGLIGIWDGKIFKSSEIDIIGIGLKEYEKESTAKAGVTKIRKKDRANQSNIHYFVSTHEDIFKYWNADLNEIRVPSSDRREILLK